MSEIVIGNSNNSPNDAPGFTGTISCVQLYNAKLNEAEIEWKKGCGEAASYKSSVCPEEYILLHETCIKVSVLFHIYNA